MSGYFTKKRLGEIKQAFKHFDTNHDGSISSNELAAVMRALGDSPTDTELMEMINEVDVDGDGTIDSFEFLAMMVQRRREHGDGNTDDAHEGTNAGRANSKRMRTDSNNPDIYYAPLAVQDAHATSAAPRPLTRRLSSNNPNIQLNAEDSDKRPVITTTRAMHSPDDMVRLASIPSFTTSTSGSEAAAAAAAGSPRSTLAAQLAHEWIDRVKYCLTGKTHILLPKNANRRHNMKAGESFDSICATLDDFLGQQVQKQVQQQQQLSAVGNTGKESAVASVNLMDSFETELCQNEFMHLQSMILAIGDSLKLKSMDKSKMSQMTKQYYDPSSPYSYSIPLYQGRNMHVEVILRKHGTRTPNVLNNLNEFKAVLNGSVKVNSIRLDQARIMSSSSSSSCSAERNETDLSSASASTSTSLSFERARSQQQQQQQPALLRMASIDYEVAGKFTLEPERIAHFPKRATHSIKVHEDALELSVKLHCGSGDTASRELSSASAAVAPEPPHLFWTAKMEENFGGKPQSSAVHDSAVQNQVADLLSKMLHSDNPNINLASIFQDAMVKRFHDISASISQRPDKAMVENDVMGVEQIGYALTLMLSEGRHLDRSKVLKAVWDLNEAGEPDKLVMYQYSFMESDHCLARLHWYPKPAETYIHNHSNNFASFMFAGFYLHTEYAINDTAADCTYTSCARNSSGTLCNFENHKGCPVPAAIYTHLPNHTYYLHHDTFHTVCVPESKSATPSPPTLTMWFRDKLAEGNGRTTKVLFNGSLQTLPTGATLVVKDPAQKEAIIKEIEDCIKANANNILQRK